MIRIDSRLPFTVNTVRIERARQILLRAIGRTEGEVDVLLTDDPGIRELNARWRSAPRPTNVLAFPPSGPLPEEMRGGFLGDVAISMETARREAEEHGTGIDARIETLLVHGIAHLLGEDHELGPYEAHRMAMLEAELIDLLHREKTMADLCINIDHVATLRQARGTVEPDPVTAAGIVELAGADGIVVHLREDRRHIQDRDVRILREVVQTRLNLEMAATDEMIGIAATIRPDIVTLVPEKRKELTTEGGLDVAGNLAHIREAVARLHEAGIPVSLFVDPEMHQIDSAQKAGAECVEIHTGRYAEARSPIAIEEEFDTIVASARHARDLELRVHAGHGLTYRNTARLAAVAEIEEFSIGHSIMARSILVGLERAVREMAAIVKTGRPA